MWTGIKFCEQHANAAINNNKYTFLFPTTFEIFLEIIFAIPVLLIATAKVPSKI